MRTYEGPSHSLQHCENSQFPWTALALESVRAPAVLVVVVPVELHQQRLLVEAQSSLLELVDLQQRILGHFQHLHVRSVNRETMSFY